MFEGMHYVCFHYEFEHDPTDPDVECAAGDCPSAAAAAQKERLTSVLRALAAAWADGPPPGWENDSVPTYLAALAAWLTDCEGYYANRGLPKPWNAWQVLEDAVRGATVYE
ncbi:DUF7660 family protein [Amycolatopsis arida]|uniref:DUF7660 family protein n=1 Tax=Amycolatopsis arida TaxID=587909 RepID=UPI0010655827|nr:hypothetical protein [Amycolatopsis arida]